MIEANNEYVLKLTNDFKNSKILVEEKINPIINEKKNIIASPLCCTLISMMDDFV